MIITKDKEIIVNPAVDKSKLPSFLSELKNIKILNLDPKLVSDSRFKTMSESRDADMIICNSVNEMKSLKAINKIAGFSSKVFGNEDIEEVILASESGADFIIVDPKNWKIIPLENIISRLHKSGTVVYTLAKGQAEVRTMFEILELGVDGVILSTDDPTEVEASQSQLHNIGTLDLKSIKVLEVKELGSGERVCVDTASMLSKGEGMLVGSKSNFMFFVHNESEGSAFTSPRPFRVNAGAVYCYTLIPGGKTKYLSEIESGMEILILNQQGLSRRAIVGRAKIETRPLKIIKGIMNGEIGTVILQNAETIALMSIESKLIPVTEVRAGDELLGFVSPKGGRHFGTEVDEYIIEK